MLDKDHPIHIPVLLDEVLQYLAPAKGQTLLDVTAGYGGHSSAILDRTLQFEGSALVDRDAQAIMALQKRFAVQTPQIIHSDFLQAAQALHDQHQQFDLILADLGVSSLHLDNADRGFSLAQSGPLDMRMDTRQKLSAEKIVNAAPVEELADIIWRYGEERKSRAIARAIVKHRPIETTDELAKVIAGAFFGKGGKQKVHPATRTFQALRIAVNEELQQIEQAMPLLIDMLKPGGRIAVISFHSLEDRIVKKAFAEQGTDTYDARLELLTKRPITASDTELALNPRSRSAKLRAAVKK